MTSRPDDANPARAQAGPPSPAAAERAPSDGAAALMRRHLDRWVAQGWLRELDRAFAGFLADEAPDADALLLLAAALASHQLGRGHACLALDAALADARQVLSLPPDGPSPATAADEPPISPPAALLAGVDLATWQAALRHPRLVSDGEGATPLVLVGARLYLRRYWRHERSVREAIEHRVAAGAALPPDTEALRRALDALFPPAAGQPAPDWQKIACALAARQPFSIVTGGPGTGKTTTVVKLLAVLQHLALADGRRLRIRLAAPTGKAAARLNESIASAVSTLSLGDLPQPQALRAAIPTQVTTLHRLLGSRPDTRHFRHDARHPLPLEVLVIDEASMVDLEMMAAVFAALPPGARLVLLGDKDQLASVEAGAVLGDLCSRADGGHYTAATRDWLQSVTGESVAGDVVDPAGRPLDQAIAKLRHSYRFDRASGIGRLAEAVNAGDVARMRAVLAERAADVDMVDLSADAAALKRLVLDGETTAHASAPSGYRRYLQVIRGERPGATEPARLDDWARSALKAYTGFQLLCAVRNGPQGVIEMNRRVAALLRDEGLVPAADGWFLGRPVMVTRNDHDLGLMNGDVGLTLQSPAADGSGAWVTRVAFPAGDGQDGIRWILPSRLQAVETVFAMTVHKSQGSEFSHAVLLMPTRPSPVSTRELVYTGITRARDRFTLATAGSGRGSLDAAVERRVQRTSGLVV